MANVAPSYPAVPFIPDDLKGCDMDWTDAAEAAFQDSKRAAAQVEDLWVIDPTLPFTLTVEGR